MRRARKELILCSPAALRLSSLASSSRLALVEKIVDEDIQTLQFLAFPGGLGG